MRISGLALWPFLLMVSTYIAYQLLLKLPRAEINILGFQTLAYFIAFIAVALLWWRNPGLGSNRFTLRDVIVALLFGVTVVGLEYGYVSAYRLGWPVNTTGTMVTVATAVMLVPIGLFAFREHLSLLNLSGLFLCCAGLWMMTIR